MSVVQRVTGRVNRMIPDRGVDPLMHANRVIGTPMSRIDGPAKVSGTADYTADLAVEGLLHARLVCSAIAKGRIKTLDTSRAEQAPGVVAVMTHRNAPELKPPKPMALGSNGAAFSDRPVMQSDAIRWNGEPIAVVAAETREQADHAAGLVEATYDAAPAALEFRGRLEQATPFDEVLGEPWQVTLGDPDRALQAAEVSVDAEYGTPRHIHMAMELHATVAQWHPDGRLTVHDATQGLIRTRHTLAGVFGIDEAAVRVLCQHVGGGFGNKTVWHHQILCAALAREVGRPVKLVLTREEVFRTIGGRAITAQRVALGANGDGRLVALVHDSVTGVIERTTSPEQVSIPARHLYAMDNYRVGQKKVEIDMVANSSMRAPGDSVGSFGLESAIDELAVALEMDPIELRRRNEPSVDPTGGTRFSIRNLIEAYRIGAERFDWEARNRFPGQRRDGDWLVGHGVASAFYPYLRMPGEGEARLRVTQDGEAIVSSAGQDMGMGTATVQIQHAAERLGLPVDKVHFEYGDSDLPASTIAAASAQTATIVLAVTDACTALVKHALKRAPADSPLAGLQVDEVVLRDGGIYSREDPGCGQTLGDLARAVGSDLDVTAKPSVMPIEFLKRSMHSYGAQFCEARVHEVTGEIRVTRWVGAFDVGRVLNPTTAGSQLRGAIIMGLGSALHEDAVFDERGGRFVNASAAEYHVPVHADVPDIDVMWTDIPDPYTPLGLHGVGEIGMVGVAAAVANAVYNATGKRVRSLPITLDKLLV